MFRSRINTSRKTTNLFACSAKEWHFSFSNCVSFAKTWWRCSASIIWKLQLETVRFLRTAIPFCADSKKVKKYRMSLCSWNKIAARLAVTADGLEKQAKESTLSTRAVPRNCRHKKTDKTERRKRVSESWDHQWAKNRFRFQVWIWSCRAEMHSPNENSQHLQKLQCGHALGFFPQVPYFRK